MNLPRNNVVELLNEANFDWNGCLDVYNYGKDQQSEINFTNTQSSAFEGLENAHLYHWHNSKLIQDLSIKPEKRSDKPPLLGHDMSICKQKKDGTGNNFLPIPVLIY